MRRREFIALVGGMAAWHSVAARAQQSAVPVIGFLSTGSPNPDALRLTWIRQGLEESGYIEGKNVAIEYRSVQGQYERLPALAMDLVSRKVACIVTVSYVSTFAAKTATSTIPIIFNVGVDPVQFGLVTSLNRPGGNLTGVAILSTVLVAKRLELLREARPDAAVVAVLVNPSNAITEPELRAAREGARTLGIQLHILQASTGSEIDAAFATLVGVGAGPLIVQGETLFFNERTRLVTLAARHEVPAIYFAREFAEAGGLMSYGPSLADTYRQIGTYVGKILNGAKPVELPVQQVAKIELVINLKTARTLGLTIPQSILLRADEVIE